MLKRTSCQKYLWTKHSRVKMRQYRLTESRIKRIIRHPTRREKGILEGAIAAMQPAEGKRYSEIWVLYTPFKKKLGSRFCVQGMRIISAWRYPGRAPERDPVPPEILKEVRGFL